MNAFAAAQIPAALRRLRRETDMFLATADSLSEDELRGPSKCEGWTRAHVVTHVARNADAFCNLVEWARTGVEKPGYTSPEARDAEIEDGATRPGAEIKADARAACERFAQAAKQLRTELVTEEVKIGSGPVPARGLLAVRMTEVLVHHDDLDTVWTLAEAGPDAQLDVLEEAVRRLRARDDVPAFSIRTLEEDEWTFGEGGPLVRGERAGVIAWITRNVTAGVSCDRELSNVSMF
ncbi:maleylpyruvate isomerase family mycothiol-dependent enzyme [Gephyromycinifex aptenodytis]|uniref:maleylpyruvate isomerase family mycothiol-dependent enzyme n=1 Tax=Gephyromycinifex aptenodytis TaxID=2716227 RepID=UPI001445A156|nr:maleylpyruvate isomerase family mycothiol-dependent enzyme [Gephyromycinifex aptenodytis]